MAKDTPVVGKTTELEFGGIIGAPFMIIGLPIAVYAINILCGPSSCSVTQWPNIPTNLKFYFDSEAVLIFLCWFAFQVILQLIPIGSVVEGMPLRTGKRLKYRCNAFFALVISLAVFGTLWYNGYPVSILYRKFIPLATTATIFAFLLSCLLYIKSFTVPNHDLAEGGNSGNLFYDFFIGRELNPRIGPLDLKCFCELRPGLIGWVMLDLSFMAAALEQYGHIPYALAVVVLFHFIYVADALWMEEAILTTMDIVHDGFGMMLAFGDLAWVPFLYTLQARFLLEHPQYWHPITLSCICLTNLTGYIIFRGSNSQKNNFRKNPNNPKLAYLETLETATGRKLLVSGWWGMCRHPNYLGDLIMATSWSLPSGFSHILPYFYPIYFSCLLVHRNMRDEASCKKKYGRDWDKYCKRVPYRIIPFIF